MIAKSHEAPSDWVAPAYSRTQIDRAGLDLATAPSAVGASDPARVVVNNWRASHGFPLNSIQMSLRGRSRRVDPEAVVAQRLKRERSLVRKLQRAGTMRLTQMQDIGGCRAVVSGLPAVQELQGLYETEAGAHDTIDADDYLTAPPESGYRSVHVIQRYHSSRKPEFDGLLIEIQLRSLLQHAWATAVETVDAFLGTDLKSGDGPDDWLRLFALLGTAFARIEGTAPVPGTPGRLTDLNREIRQLARQVELTYTLNMWGSTVDYIAEPDFRAQKYLLLEMRPDKGSMSITPFRQREFEEATEAYSRVEVELAEIAGAQAVLVSVDSLKNLRRSYPTYFADSSLFLSTVLDIVGSE